MAFFFLFVFFFVVESNSINLNNHCAKHTEWDPVMKICRVCRINTTYDETLRKCIDIENINKTCEDGYEYDHLERKCLDINECNQKINVCKRNEYCKNFPGSYKCYVKEYCGQGYDFDTVTQTCMDIDECAPGEDYCDSSFVCENINGSFNCRPPCPPSKPFYWRYTCQPCIEGYMINRVTKKCEDVDECLHGIVTCERFKQKCVTIPGMSRCVHHCSGGTIDVENQCIDIDECSENKHNCSSTQRCINYFGLFKCKEIHCNENEYLNYRTKECLCKPGFERNPDSQRCKDIDECDNHVPVCGGHGKCINTISSYNCICDEGFHSKNGTCLDIDECTVVRDICDYMICVNTIGSFDCICPTGFKPYENICVDVNECLEMPGNNMCRNSTFALNEQFECFNLIGSFLCIKSDCPVEYRTLSETLDTKICQLSNIQCSYNNNKGCFQQLPEKIIYRVVQLRNSQMSPYKIAVLELGDQQFNPNHYHTKINLKKSLNKNENLEIDIINSIILRTDTSEKGLVVYITMGLPDTAEIVFDIYLKSVYGSTEKMISLNEFYIYVNNGF